jgi:hypothetical protein
MRHDIFQMLADHRVKVITFPPHTTNIFQSLDVSLFGVFKSQMNSKIPFDTDESATGFIKRIFHNMKQTPVPDNVRSAFVNIGIRYHVDVDPYLLIFDEYVLRESEKFLALRRCDCPLQDLSPRRRSARFGWVNRENCITWTE